MNRAIYHRHNPFASQIQERFLATKEGSSRKGYHLSLSLTGSELVYQPGDCVAVLPANYPYEVDRFTQFVHSSDQGEVREALLTKFNLRKASPVLQKALGATGECPLTLLTNHSQRFSKDQFYSFFLPLLPRFYSIASSPLVHPSEVHLLIAEVDRGVCYDFLCERAVVQQTPVPLYLQPTRKFLLPSDPHTPIIMIGPGTGVAPYRAFLQERMARNDPGRNWLFFGARNRATDFYYEDFFSGLQRRGGLHLSCAFSRDTPEKIYVQHKLWEERKKLWAWIEEGASLYLCGDAKSMAKDVEAMIKLIFTSEGDLSEEQAQQKLKLLRLENRYLVDVY